MKALMSCCVMGVACCIGWQASSAQDAGLDVAEYSDAGELLFPDDTDTWIHLGSALGSDYSNQEFSADNPGVLGVVKMEPAAYAYLLENGEYADGTMLLLSFYAAESATTPELRGFVQGQMVQREIHVIDRERFDDEGRAFYLYSPAADRAPAIATGSECVACHEEHGAYDGTFTQFYPLLRELVP